MQLEHTARRDGTLLAILRGEMGLSSGLVGRLKYQKSLLVEGEPRRTNYPVRAGDRITVLLREPEPEYPAEDGPIHILYEDEAVIAVDKPPGLLVHPSFHRNTGTLANYLLGYYRASGQASAVHPVTRLDRDTFGIVLLAKNTHVHALLSAMQRTGKLHKTYHAVLCGTPEAQTIDAPIARPDPRSLRRCVRADGKRAVTVLTPLQTAGSLTLAELQPVTGRTHQLRVHCAYIGCPLLGDPQYGTPESFARAEALGLTHQLLCAKRLRFAHPLDGRTLELASAFSLPLENFVARPQQDVYNEGETPYGAIPQR